MSTRKTQFERNTPLLYIAQPVSGYTLVNMQNTFTSSKEHIVPANIPVEKKTFQVEKLDEEHEGQFEDKSIKLHTETHKAEEADVEKPVIELAVKEQKIKTEIHEEDDRVPAFRKPFKLMDNREKVQFLINKPKYIPKVICEILTEDETIIGVINHFREETVLVDPINKNMEPVHIPIGSILEIKMKQEFL
ncbi:CotO family spore coat protein [Heyndrickxia acidicola]|uniref:CotO family spore coat protein n=1 Tax=Heyndrickxia acidicola TaxID=209389 RepID=A0ABU6MDP8_9BACI|nr:CotO family spore coat protein [Heyndrickxia acidicola]MED1202537.1 CotO family spore coat protein [Heyndrickxia acidicola]